MANYEVHYAFEVAEGYEDQEGNKYARGKVDVTTDVPIETEEHVRELTKQIYRQIDNGTHSIIQLAVDAVYNLDEQGAKIELAG